MVKGPLTSIKRRAEVQEILFQEQKALESYLCVIVCACNNNT